VTIRSGFEPVPTHETISTDSVAGNDQEGKGPEFSRNQSEEASEETRRWGERDDHDQEPGTSDSRYEELDDGDVWKTTDGHDV
jgi:hypothetical protein